MKNKKLLQLQRDLRLVTNRSFHFGSEKKKGLWKNYRKYIIGGTVGAIGIGAGIAASHLLSKNSTKIVPERELTEQEKREQINIKREQNIQEKERQREIRKQQEIEKAYQEGKKRKEDELLKLEPFLKLRYRSCKRNEELNYNNPKAQSECVKAGLEAREAKIKEFEEIEKKKLISAGNAYNRLKQLDINRENRIKSNASKHAENFKSKLFNNKNRIETNEQIIADQDIIDEATAIKEVAYAKSIHNGLSEIQAQDAAEKALAEFMYKQKKLQRNRIIEQGKEERRQNYLQAQEKLNGLKDKQKRLEDEKREKERIAKDIEQLLKQKDLDHAEATRLHSELQAISGSIAKTNQDLELTMQQQKEAEAKAATEKAKAEAAAKAAKEEVEASNSFGRRKKQKTLKQLKALCKKQNIRLTVKRGKKRVPKSKKMLLKNLKNKIKR